jgi:hypothetical protein
MRSVVFSTVQRAMAGNSALAAAMDVMLMLDATKLDYLRAYFMKHDNHELPLDEFVAIMLHFFPAGDKVCVFASVL